MNFTVSAPPGTTDHGTPGLICVPPQWTDVFTFFATNYFAHAATVQGRPGQSAVETALGVTAALFVPGSGALRTLRYFIRRPALVRRDELQRAAAAGALCMVVRPPGAKRAEDPERGGLEMRQLRPRPLAWPEAEGGGNAATTTTTTTTEPAAADDDEVETAPPASTGSGTGPPPRPGDDGWFSRIFQGHGRTVNRLRKFHGRLVMPPGDEGFELVECPFGTPLKPFGATADDGAHFRDFHLGASYSVPKILIGLVQALWAVFTLYRTRGNQLDLYGYAAFGLSVAPYAFMSILNTLSNLLAPEYPTMFLVHTPDLEAARAAGGTFAGVIAAVDVEAEVADPEHRVELDFGGVSDDTAVWMALLGFLFAAAPIAIVGGMSRFQPGSISSASDRGWLMSWLVVGSASSWLVRGFNLSLDVMGHGPVGTALAFLLLVGPLFIPAIGGMVTVARVLQSYGICTEIGP